MKILYVIDSLDRGGTEQSLVELLGALGPLGVEPALFVLRETQSGLEADVRALGIEIHHAKASAPHRRVADLRREITRIRPEVVHTALYESDQIGRIAARRSGVPVLTSLVNTFNDPARRANPAVKPWKRRIVSAFDGFTARHLTHHFHAVSHTVARSAVATLRVPPENITVVERGRDAARLGKRSPERRALVRDALGLDTSDEVVLAVGRQEHQKGHRFLVAAFEQVAASHPSAVLLIAGRTGGTTRELEARRGASPVADRIRFLGARSDVPDLLVAADVFAFPSLYEGLPGAIIEAMALEIPVVASDIEPVRELVDDRTSALLVPVGDSTALASAVTTCLDDPSFARSLASHAHERFTAHFTLARSAEQMHALYRRMRDLAHR